MMNPLCKKKEEKNKKAPQYVLLFLAKVSTVLSRFGM